MDHDLDRTRGGGDEGEDGGPGRSLYITISISLCVIMTERNYGYETTDAFHRSVIPTLPKGAHKL